MGRAHDEKNARRGYPPPAMKARPSEIVPIEVLAVSFFSTMDIF